LLQIYRYDDAVERLQLVIADDADDVGRARDEFAMISEGSWGEA